MPGPSAFETVTYLREHCPKIKVLMLTVYSNEVHVHKLVAAGVAGYVLKDEIEEAVVRAIHTVMQGDTWFSRKVVDKLAQPATSEAPPVEKPTLTEREVEVLRLLARGYSNARIAQELGISGPTVRFHLRNIYDKTGLQSRTEAVAWAIQQGLVDEG